MEKSALHLLGYFSKLHGYKGELTAALDTDDQSSYEGLKNIFVEQKGQLIPYFIELLETKTNTSVKVKLEGIDNEAAAKALVKCSIYIDPKDMSEADEDRLALRAVAGFKVIDAVKGLIGKLQEIEEGGNNPLMVVHNGQKEILLPMNADLITSIDRRKKEIHIEAPAGLIDFYLEQ